MGVGVRSSAGLGCGDDQREVDEWGLSASGSFGV